MVGWHRSLQAILASRDWPLVQQVWLQHGGPKWDPWGLAVILEKARDSLVLNEFKTFLHHPIRPNAALWVWVATPEIKTWPDLSPCAPAQALDHVLRRLEPPANIPEMPHFWQAWREWVAEPPPDADVAVDSGYPHRLFHTWQYALQQAESDPVALPGSGGQLSWGFE